MASISDNRKINVLCLETEKTEEDETKAIIPVLELVQVNCTTRVHYSVQCVVCTMYVHVHCVA